MSDVFVVFGSSSDSHVYKPLVERLTKSGISTEFRVLSAHKTPKDLRDALRDTNAEIFVAGAGLAAALPGVLASEEIKPVIGLPCEGAFSGMDSFLSCAQMPPDVPVITVGVGDIDAAVRLCNQFLHGLSRIVIVPKKTGEEKKYFDKCVAFMKENSIPHMVGRLPKKPEYTSVFIDFVKLGKKVPKHRGAVINVLVKEKTKKADAVKFFDSLQGTYCVGLNNYKNAALAALSLVNLRHGHDQKILELRRSAAKKVMDANK
ncbi:MAG: AIR carboxylase family protein [archaeon]|nr:AIR carboxylase family protein [archaeon]